jgi:nitroreductase
MDASEAIKGRRSIRKYKEEPLFEEQVTQILEAGRWAPSRGNNQPWKLIVLKDEQIRKELAFKTGLVKNMKDLKKGVNNESC